jgi:hypothetical protein
MVEDAERVMKRCQIGTTNYEESNNLHAECYGTIGRLVLEVNRLNDLLVKVEDARALMRVSGKKNPKVSEATARSTIQMMRTLANNAPISPFHNMAANEMESLLEEVLKYRKGQP